MNSHRIEIVLKVAELRSISAAAEVLFLSQPTVSNAISALEKEIGFSIFERTNKGLIITEKGQEFLFRAIIISEQMDYISHINEKSSYCHLHVSSLLSPKIEEAFYNFCLNHKNASNLKVSYTFYALSVEDAIDSLIKGNSDVAIALCREDMVDKFYEEYSPNFSISQLSLQESLIACAPNHPLANEELTAENISKYSLILFDEPRFSHYYVPINTYSYYNYKKAIMVQSSALGKKFAKEGLGIMFCEEENLDVMKEAGLICRPIGVKTSFLCITMKDKRNNAYIDEFVKELKSNYNLQ